MSQATQQTMKCTSCGLKYPWSPQTAGRKVKCKCGTVFVAPQSAGGADQPMGAPMVTSSSSSTPVGSPKVQAAVAQMASPAAPPPLRNAESARAASPPRSPSPLSQPVPPRVDDNDDALYDIAGDMEAPPPLAPVAHGPPVPHGPPVAKSGGARKGAAGAGHANMPAFPGYTAKRIDDSAEKKTEIKKLIVIAGGIAVLVGAVILIKAIGLGGDGADKYANLPGEDPTFYRMKDDQGAYEARAWLNENNQRGIIGFEWTRDKTLRKIDEWYAAGAKNVYSFGASPFTASLAIELPDDPAKRKTLIDYAEQFRKDRNQYSKKPVTDEGQKFIILQFMQIST
jgi:hypothetical protein